MAPPVNWTAALIAEPDAPVRPVSGRAPPDVMARRGRRRAWPGCN